MTPELYKFGYVLVEGMDFTGKTTIAHKLARKFTVDGPISATYNNSYFSNLHRGDSSLDSRGKESYYGSLYFKDKLVDDLPAGMVVQDRYFPSILFYGNIMNTTAYPSLQEMATSYIMPRAVLLFERSYEEMVEVSRQRDHLSSLERRSVESENQYREMKDEYRDLIRRLGVWFTTIDTTQTTEDLTLTECYQALVDSDALIENVCVDDLCVNWEPRVYPSTAEEYADKIRRGEQVKPLIVHRRFNLEEGVSMDLIEDGRHRAYAHHLTEMVEARAYIERIPTDMEIIRSFEPVKLKDFSFK